MIAVVSSHFRKIRDITLFDDDLIKSCDLELVELTHFVAAQLGVCVALWNEDAWKWRSKFNFKFFLDSSTLQRFLFHSAVENLTEYPEISPFTRVGCGRGLPKLG